MLTELNRHHGGNFVAERSLMQAAREKGYLTAALGKVGPVGIHDLTQLDGKTTIFFDDDTGKKNGIVLRPDVVEQLKKAGLPLETPGRAQRSETPGKTTNIIQQKYYRDIVTKVLLPHFKEQKKPFMLLYWSSDPDGTQHSQRDSLDELTPGINGPTSLAAIKVADDDLAAIMDDAEGARPRQDDQHLRHGGSRLQHDVEAEQDQPVGEAQLRDHSGRTICRPGSWRSISPRRSASRCTSRSPKGPAVDYKAGKHPRRAQRDPRERSGEARRGRSRVNGGNDLIYFPQGNGKELAPKVVKALLAQDYTSGVFVRRRSRAAFPARLPLSDRRPERRRAHADARDRGELPLRDDRLRPAAVLRRHRHRRHADAGPGPSRQLQPRRHGELHGGDRPGLQGGLPQRDAGEQCRHRADACADHRRQAARRSASCRAA